MMPHTWLKPVALSSLSLVALSALGQASSTETGGKDATMPYKWIKITEKAEFAPRDGAGALVWSGKMWLLGGWNPADKTHFPRTCNNEVWSSKDGAAWTLEKANTFLDASFDHSRDWEGRHTAGYLVFKDRIWILGGGTYDTPQQPQRKFFNDVWKLVRQ